MTDEKIYAQIIKREDLKPGDLIMIRCPGPKVKELAQWAEMFFKGCSCQIGILPEEVSIEFKVARVPRDTNKVSERPDGSN